MAQVHSNLVRSAGLGHYPYVREPRKTLYYLVEALRFAAVVAHDGSTLYLRRLADAGQSAYDQDIPFEYQGDYLAKFRPRPPEGSRADVRGKGRWQDGRWTVELQRKLDTGHDDDVVFAMGRDYLFAVGCSEMAYMRADPTLTQPLYGTGDAFDRLILAVR